MDRSAHYRDFDIFHVTPPIPIRTMDYEAAHVEYDGPEDNRIFHGESIADCMDQIDEYYSDLNADAILEDLESREAVAIASIEKLEKAVESRDKKAIVEACEIEAKSFSWDGLDLERKNWDRLFNQANEIIK